MAKTPNSQLSEFDIINTYFSSHARAAGVDVSVGDDAAVLTVPQGNQLVVSTDTSIAGQHFFKDADPADIAYKSIAVSLSDMAAMGATPKWLLLNVSIETVDPNWLDAFSRSCFELLTKFNVALVGGDITKGPLSITTTVHGWVKRGQALLRSGAKVGDQIAISKPLGEAGLAVYARQHQIQLSANDKQLVNQALMRPTPEVVLGKALIDYASAAIDISDGLSADLSHLLAASGVGAKLYQNQLPISPSLAHYIPAVNTVKFALDSGDHYGLCFTVPAAKQGLLDNYLASTGQRCYWIGEVISDSTLMLVDAAGRLTPLKSNGFKHFG